MIDVKVGQIWYNQERNDSAVIVKITDEEHPVVWWYEHGFMNKDCLYHSAFRFSSFSRFFQKNGYELVKEKV